MPPLVLVSILVDGGADKLSGTIDLDSDLEILGLLVLMLMVAFII